MEVLDARQRYGRVGITGTEAKNTVGTFVGTLDEFQR
jgi:hypothetical protein